MSPLPITTPPKVWKVRVSPALNNKIINIMNHAILNQSRVVAGNLTTITTVGALVGPKGQITTTSNSILNKDKALVLRLINEKNEAWQLICSTNVSSAIRNKELKLSELGDFPIVEYTTQGTQEVIPMIVFPEGLASDVITLEATKFSKTPFTRKSAYKPEDLIAL